MSTEYYGAAQFQTILEQRHHDDSFFTEIIMMTSAFDQDISDAMRTDIMSGNTAMIRRHYKVFQRKATDFIPTIWNGVTVPGAPSHGPIIDHTFYGIVPIKDDYSTFVGGAGTKGYHELPETDARRIQVYDALSSLNMNAEDFVEGILEPEPIGTVGSPEFSKYERAWNSSKDLQAEYPTLAAYNQDLNQDQIDQQKQMIDVTDIYVGIFVVGDTISEVNRSAIYFTMAHIFPQITFNGLSLPSPHDDLPPLAYVYQFQSGNFLITNGWKGWSHVIRVGVVKNEFDLGGTVRYRKGKSSHRIVTIHSSPEISINDGDPIHQVLVQNELELASWPGVTRGMIEIQVQLPTLPNGTRVYGEIRVWSYTTLHTNIANNGIDIVNIKASIGGEFGPQQGGAGNIKFDSPSTVTVPDGSVNITTLTTVPPSSNFAFDLSVPNPDASFFTLDPVTGVITANAPLDYSVQNVYYLKIIGGISGNTASGAGIAIQYLVVNVENTNNVSEPPSHLNPFKAEMTQGSNLVFFPLEYKAVRELPFFKRERFIRESVCIGMYNIEEVEIKWYQKGWFKVVLFIISVVLAVVTGPAGFAGLLSLQTVAVAAATIVLSMIVAEVIMNAIDDPMIAAMLVLVIGFVTKNFSFDVNTMSLANMASLAMEATETYIQKHFAEQLEKLKEEMLEWQKKMKAAEAELQELAEQAGDMGFEGSMDVIKFLASLPKVEEADTFMDRATNVDNAIIDDVDNMTSIANMLKLY